jgi:hypothetical protein
MKIYLRFVNLAHALEDEFVRTHFIDLRGLKLLETISIHHSQERSLKVTDLMTLTQFGSPAAIHKSLRLLRDSGLVLDFHKLKDRRAKYLCSSEIANSHYSKLGAVLMESVREAS